jgi:hypothetical protein
MITGSAIRTSDGRVWSLPKPARHRQVFEAIWFGIGLSDINCKLFDEYDRRTFSNYIRDNVSGFMTDTGEFLDRDAALAHVRACGQEFKADRVCSTTKRILAIDEIIGGVLTSEDLW